MKRKQITLSPELDKGVNALRQQLEYYFKCPVHISLWENEEPLIDSFAHTINVEVVIGNFEYRALIHRAEVDVPNSAFYRVKFLANDIISKFIVYAIARL